MLQNGGGCGRAGWIGNSGVRLLVRLALLSLNSGRLEELLCCVSPSPTNAVKLGRAFVRFVDMIVSLGCGA